MKRYIFILFLFLITLPFIYSQQDNDSGYITIIPGEQFAASGLYEVWFGKHWREVWTTPVRVEILNIDDFAGGLTPIKKGGGMQTKSLRFKGNDGKIWKFRSIEKDPSKVLPEELRESVAEDIIKDQISTANPFAALVVTPLLDAVGIFEAEPKLVFLPDDEKLGEFRKEFGGILGFIEEHPSEGEDGSTGFENAIDVKGTFKLFNYLSEKRSQKIDTEMYLRARLIDILTGDWDRHTDQWRWAKFDSTYNGEKIKIWKPIPRDRDQAITKYDGVFPFLAAYLVPQLNNFGEDYPQIEDLTWSGRFLDRRVLTVLSKSNWDSVTSFVKLKITDEVIERAIKRLPQEVLAICYEELSTKLKSRRDNLQWASEEFYNLVNKYAEVYCSDEDDYIEVYRIDDKSIEVSVFRRDKDTGEKKGKPLFYKIFDNDITIDIRIHMNNGDDKAYVYGQSSESPDVRIIGGKGKDEFVDESSVQGYFLSFTPFPVVEQRTNFYDSGKNTIVVEGPGTDFDDAKWPEPKDDLEKYEPQQIDRGHNWLPVPIFGLDTDYGLTIGGGVKLLKYNFREIPMEYSQQLTVSYATSFGNFGIEYEGDFYSLLRWGRLNLLIAETQQFVTRYFGYGNETSYNKNLEQSNYYDVNQRLTTIYPTMFYSFKKNIVGSLGVSFVRTNTSLQNDTLLTGFRYGDYGLGKLDPFGIHLGLIIDGRDHPDFPTNGYWINFIGRIFPELFNVEEAFYYSEIDLRGYVTPEFSSFVTFAFRAGGSKVFGKYPFFGGATVGGSKNLRGYNDKRFSGDAAVFGQTEFRIFITRLNLLFKSRLGINLFAETGRVFTEGIKSDKWHPSYGFGIWIAYLNSTIIGSTYVAFSPERTTFSLGIGMGF